MNPSHLDQSRVTKAFTDNSDLDFAEADRRLRGTRVAVTTLGADLSIAAAQWCTLTALNTVRRTFGSVALVADDDVPLLRPMPGAVTLSAAAKRIRATLHNSVPADTTHLIVVGPAVYSTAPFIVRCWWNGWQAGVRAPWHEAYVGDGWNPLSGIFAAACSVREIFANVRGTRGAARASTLSLWEPWVEATHAEVGPHVTYCLNKLHLVGLGHLGQGVLWSLCALPMAGAISLQDYQAAAVENEATGLITWPMDIGRRKTRIASDWMEAFGWDTSLIERRFDSDTRAQPTDPAVVVTALDSPVPRRHVHAAGYAFMFDVGVGHGPVDFESAQLRTFARGDAGSWQHAPAQKDVAGLLDRPAYKAMSADACGAYALAEASVAVPFVGAATGALAVAQLARVAAMEPLIRLMQIELGAPDLASYGSMLSAPSNSVGAVEMDLLRRITRLQT